MMRELSAKIHSLLICLAQILLLAACYFLAGEASFSLSVSHNIVTLVVFAAEGFALAGVILAGLRVVPGVFLGQLLLALNNDLSLATAVGISVINSLEAVIGCLLFRHFKLQADLSRMRDASSLLLLIFLVLQPFSASFGCLLLWLGGVIETASLKNAWFYWWFGNAMGQVLITPLLLSFIKSHDSVKERFYKALLILVVMVPISLLVLMQERDNMILAFTVTTPLLILTAIHLRMNAATLATAIFATVALFYTHKQTGVFVEDDETLLLSLNIFLLGMALCSLFVAALLNERSGMEEKLRASEQRFIDMVNTTNGIVWEADAATFNFTFVSSKAERLLGYPVNDWYRPGFWRAHLPPEDKEWVSEYCIACTKELKNHDFEYRFLAKDGRTVWLRNIVSVVEETGRPRWLRGIMVDISGKKMAEQALQDSELRFRSTFENAPVGVVNVSLEGGFLEANPCFCKMMGYSRRELLQMNIKDITHPDYWQAGQRKMKQTILGEISGFTIEKQYVRKDSRVIWGSLSVSLFRHADNSPHYFIGTLQDITLKKQDEERIKLSQSYGGIGIWEADLSHDTQKWSEEVYTLLGFPKTPAPSWKDFLAAIHPEDRQKVINSTEAHLLYHAKYDVEYRIVNDKGETRWMRSAGRAERDAEGRPIFFRGIVQDISERKLMEQALRDSERKFRAIINSSPVPMALNDEKQNITLLNSAFVKTFGYTLEDIPTLSDWWPKAYPDASYREWVKTGWGKNLEKARRQGKDFETIELRVRCKNGQYKTVVGNAAPLKQRFADEHLVVLYDVSERTQMEKSLRDNEQLLQSVMDILPVGLWILDGKGNIIRANPSAKKIWEGAHYVGLEGYSQYKAWWLDTRQPLAPEEWGGAKAITRGETSLDEELEIECFDGSHKIIANSALPLFDEYRQVKGAIVVNRDITENKRAEQELQRSNADLEQFAYAVSHDMRQPLRMVKSYLDLLERSLAARLDEQERQFFDFALDGARRMDEMILALLDFSRVGRKTEAMKLIDTGKSLDEALSFLAPEISATKASIDIEGEWPELVGSRDEMTRLMQNLVGNALKYHEPDCPPQVCIRAKVKEDCFQVSVIDDGIGIDPGQQERLFKVFSRLQARSRYEGTGVGLALCRKIVEHHGGKIWVESEGEGTGSAFIFSIPVKKEHTHD